MSLVEHLLILVAAVAAGSVNAVAGGGSLITFPVLLAAGLSPVTASVVNTVGLFPGYVGGALGYRNEISQRRKLMARLVPPSAMGAVGGAVLLLVAPGDVFAVVVPWLVLASAGLLILQPRLARIVARRRDGNADEEVVSPVLWGATFVAAAYGAYFGGALGVILLATLGSFLSLGIQDVNGVKSGLSVVINGVAVAIFLFSPLMSWSVAALMWVGSLAGGHLGASVARRLGAAQLRALVVAFATVVGLILLVRSL